MKFSIVGLDDVAIALFLSLISSLRDLDAMDRYTNKKLPKQQPPFAKICEKRIFASDPPAFTLKLVKPSRNRLMRAKGGLSLDKAIFMVT